MSNKFSVGDLVYHKNHECIYEVVRITSGHFSIILEGGRRTAPLASSSHYLEYARIANTKINRKLYPKYKVIGEWLEVNHGTD